MAIRYQNVADDIRRLITSGAFAAGSKLPVEGELAAKYRVGLMTLRRALDVLQDEGLVEKHHGRGNYVRRTLQRITYTGSRDSGEAGVCLHVAVETAKVAAEGTVSELLGVPAGRPLTEYTYLGERDGLPRSLAHVYVPRDFDVLPPGAAVSPWGDDVREALVASGVAFATTVERVSARFPTSEEAKALRITARTSVLAIERTSIDVNGQVVVVALLVLPGDRAEARFVTFSQAELEATQ